jgi:hypothetical protein
LSSIVVLLELFVSGFQPSCDLFVLLPRPSA